MSAASQQRTKRTSETWKTAFRPRQLGQYVNDHTLFRDKDGRYRLLGITSATGSHSGEKYFIEAVADSIDGPYRETRKLFTEEPNRGFKYAPHVVRDGSVWHLFFAPGTIHHYTSTDGIEWVRAKPAVRPTLRRFFPALRDPMVFRDRGRWLMYLTDAHNRISVYESKDLYDWEYRGAALTVGSGYPRSLNSSCESPFVFEKDGTYYLATTVVPGRLSGAAHWRSYNHTVVLASKDPLQFGVLSTGPEGTARVVDTLDTHAPELVRDEHDDLWVTSAGWKGWPRPPGVEDGTLAIRRYELPRG